jgi:hypothetical protein
MKWIALVMLSLSTAAWATDACIAQCTETVKQCQDVCKKTLKKEAADKIPFCQDKCKEFDNECKKDCSADDKSKGR